MRETHISYGSKEGQQKGMGQPERAPEHLTREDWLGERKREVRRVIQACWDHDRPVELIGGICRDQSARGEWIAVDLFNDPERVAHSVRVKDGSMER